MATLLAYIRVKPSALSNWEAAISGLVDRTFAEEHEVIRYEYWKGQQPNTYYALVSFTNAAALTAHQQAQYYKAFSIDTFIEAVEIEYVDPVHTASPLPQTKPPASIAPWWAERD